MAAQEYHHGDQDISENKAAYLAFLTATKWSSLVLAAGLVALVVWFCTNQGFIAGAVASVVILILGYMLLRKRPAKSAGH